MNFEFYQIPAHNIGQKTVLKRNVEVPFTITEIERISKDYQWQVKELAKHLRGETVGETTKNIWLFIRKHVRYDKIEAEGDDEILRTPSQLFYEGQGDCDCYTITISSILRVLGIPHVYRVVAYLKPNVWRHIYPVAIYKGREYPIDCVPEIHTYNYELPFLTKFDTYQPIQQPMGKTTQLGNAKSIFASVFTGFDNNQVVNKRAFGLMILKRILEALKEFFMNLPADEAPAEVIPELILIENCLEVWDNREARNQALQKAAKESLMYGEIYTKMLTEAEKFEKATGEDTVKNILEGAALAGGKSLGFADILNSAGTIVTSIFGNKAQKDASNAATQQAQINADATKAAAAAQIKISENALKAEELKNEGMLKAAALQVAASRNTTTTTPTTEQPAKEPIKKMWWWIGGGVLFVLLMIIAFVAFRKPAAPMGKATKTKRRRPNTMGKATKPKKRKPAKKKGMGNATAGVKKTKTPKPPAKKKPAKKKPAKRK